MISRRTFLLGGSALALSLYSSARPRLAWANAPLKRTFAPKVDSVVLLWMAGGMAHTETFDPKPRREFKKGLDQRRLLSTFGSIPTSVDGVMISQGLERIASIIDRSVIIRSCTGIDLEKDHTRAQYLWHTGYVPPQTVAAPHLGSVIYRTLGKLRDDAPGFVHIGQSLEGRPGEQVRAYLTAGFLGSEFNPLLISNPADARRLLQPPAEFSPTRVENRYKFYQRLLESRAEEAQASSFQRDSLLQAVDNAHRLINSPVAAAFDLELEPPESRAIYNTSKFGLGCLLARRLVEAGVRFIEVSSEYIPFDNWDTHRSGHKRTIELKRWIDAPVAQLVLDLEQRGLLNRTLIIIASEFSRATGKNPAGKDKPSPPPPIQNETQYGLHQHFGRGGSMLLIGGGIRRGTVYGRTSDEHPCETVENPVVMEDAHATIYKILDIPADLSYDVEKRPFYVTRDGIGKSIDAILKV